MVGKSIRHYRIIEEIGAGGMGVVYKAEDTRLGRTVALKFFPESAERPPSYRARLEREARAASRLDHPNVATVYSFEEVDDECFICMAYVEGDSLRDRIARGPIPVEEALRIAIQICDGLGAAHREGIIHLDIKPGNILINRDGVVKIVDFGLARAMSPNAESLGGVSYASTPYMSPEQAWGDPVDERSDVYSVGVVIYELLSGNTPFPGNDQDALLHELLNVNPRMQPVSEASRSPQVDEVVRRCLEKSQAERFRNAGELSDQLRRASQQLGRMGRRRRETRIGSRARWWAVGTFIAAATTLGLLLWPRTASNSPPRRVSIGFEHGYGIEIFNRQLSPGWEWLRENPGGWSFDEYPGYLTVALESGDLWATWTNNNRNMLLRDAPSGEFAIETHLYARLKAHINQAHLILYQDDDNYVRFGLVRGRNGISVTSIHEVAGSPLPQKHITYAVDAPGLQISPDSLLSIYLRITVTRDSTSLLFSEDGTWWYPHSTIDSISFSPLKIGIAAFDGSEPPSESKAIFDYFGVVPPGEHEFRSGDP